MERFFGPNEMLLLLNGFQWTIMIAAVAFIGGIPGGLAIALLRTSGNKWLSGAANAFIQVFQGTPLLMQLFIVYYGSALLTQWITPWISVAIAFTLHASAFLGEIWRGSIEAVPRGQNEAAKALGLSYISRMRDVVAPQALRISLSATVGFLVQLIKGTSLASIVGFSELSRMGQLVTNVTYQPFTVYFIVATLYFALCWPLSVLSGMLETRFNTAEK